jgi:hypothetical protein
LPALGSERPHRQHPVHISNLLSMGGVKRLAGSHAIRLGLRWKRWGHSKAYVEG